MKVFGKEKEKEKNDNTVNTGEKWVYRRKEACTVSKLLPWSTAQKSALGHKVRDRGV